MPVDKQPGRLDSAQTRWRHRPAIWMQTALPRLLEDPEQAELLPRGLVDAQQ